MASHDQNLRNSVEFEGDESHLGASVQSTTPPPPPPPYKCSI